MRAKELVQEGPIWSGIKSAVTGGTYAAGANVAKGQQQIAKMAKDAEPTWFKTQAAYQQRGVDPKQLATYLTQWTRKWFEVPNLPDYATSVKSPQVTDQGVRKYLQIAASHYLAPDQEGGQQPAPGAGPTPGGTAGPTPAPGGGSPAPGGTAGPTPAGSPTPAPGVSGNPAPTPGGTAEPTPGAEPQQPAAPEAPKAEVDPAHAMFKDPAAFKAEWDKFVASKPNYNLITDPALLAVLKNMWMRSGGLKAESKKNKGQRV